jgi:hypothetical protein
VLSLESITQSAAIGFKIATERGALQNRSSPRRDAYIMAEGAIIPPHEHLVEDLRLDKMTTAISAVFMARIR